MIGRLVQAKGYVAIVETVDGKVCRALPAAAVRRLDGDAVDVSELDWARGVEHGIRWDDLSNQRLCVPVAALQAAFTQRGLRAASDVLQHPRLAREAVLDALGDVVNALLALDKSDTEVTQ